MLHRHTRNWAAFLSSTSILYDHSVWDSLPYSHNTGRLCISHRLFRKKAIERHTITVLSSILWQNSLLLLPLNSLPQSTLFMQVFWILLHTEPSRILLFLLWRHSMGRRVVIEATLNVRKIFRSLLKLFLPEESFQTHFTTFSVSCNPISANRIAYFAQEPPLYLSLQHFMNLPFHVLSVKTVILILKRSETS